MMRFGDLVGELFVNLLVEFKYLKYMNLNRLHYSFSNLPVTSWPSRNLVDKKDCWWRFQRESKRSRFFKISNKEDINTSYGLTNLFVKIYCASPFALTLISPDLICLLSVYIINFTKKKSFLFFAKHVSHIFIYVEYDSKFKKNKMTMFQRCLV